MGGIVLQGFTMAWYPRQLGTSETLFKIGAASAVPFTLDASAFTSPHTWILPDSNGTSGYALSTNGSGILSWAPITGVAPRQISKYTALRAF